MNEEMDTAAREYAERRAKIAKGECNPLTIKEVRDYLDDMGVAATSNEHAVSEYLQQLHNNIENLVGMKNHLNACAASKQQEIDRLVVSLRTMYRNYVIDVNEDREPNAPLSELICDIRVARSILSQYPVTDKSKSNG